MTTGWLRCSPSFGLTRPAAQSGCKICRSVSQVRFCNHLPRGQHVCYMYLCCSVSHAYFWCVILCLLFACLPCHHVPCHHVRPTIGGAANPMRGPLESIAVVRSVANARQDCPLEQPEGAATAATTGQQLPGAGCGDPAAGEGAVSPGWPRLVQQLEPLRTKPRSEQ